MQRYRVNYTLLIGLIVGSVVAAGSIYGIWSWQMTNNASSMLERANEAEAAGNYREAAGLLNDYLAFRPGDDEIRLRQAELYVEVANQAIEQGEIEYFGGAKKAVTNTLFKYPDKDELRADLVELLMRPELVQFFAQETLGHVKTLLAKTPDDPELLYKQAICHNLQKEYRDCADVLFRLVGYEAKADGGEGAFDAGTAIAPDRIEAYAMLARTLHTQLKDPDLAIDVENQMVDVNPDSAEAYLERGRFLSLIDQGEGSSQDHGEQSSQDLQKAFELDPESSDVLLALAAEAQDEGDFDKTREYLEKGLELGTDMYIFYSGLGRLERAKGNVDSAIEQIERGLEAVDERQRKFLLLDKIDFQLDAKNIAGAEETIKQLEREVEFKLPEIEFYQARILADQEQWYQASKLLEQVRPKLSGNPQPRYQRMRPQVDMLLGFAYRKVGHYEKALEVFEQLAREYPSNKAALAQAADLRQRLTSGGSKKEVDPTNFNASLAEELKKPEEEQDWKAFDAYLEQWIEENERSDVQRKLLKAQVLVSRKMYKEAQQPLREAYDMAKEDLAVQRAVVRLVAVDPDRGPEDALKLLDRTVDDFGDQWQLRLDRADLYLAMNEETLVEDLMALTEGIDEWDRSRQVELWKGIAARLARAGKREESEAAWNTVAEMNPDDLRTLMQVFDLALIRNDDEAMREAQNKVLKLVGSKRDANWAFAEAARKFVEFRRDPSKGQLREEILGLTKTVLEDRPDWSAPYILRAGLHVSERNYLDALKDYKEGFSRGRGNAQALSQYVKLLAAQGSVSEALEQLDQFDAVTNVALIGETYPKLLLNAGRYRDAAEAADRIGSAGAENPKVQLWYGNFMQAVSSIATAPEDLRTSCQEKAGTALATAVEAGGDSPAPWLAYITHLLSARKMSDAEDALRRAQLQLEEDQQQLLKARCYEMTGRWFDAENIYRVTYDQNPDSEQVARQLATFYLSKRYPLRDGPQKAAKLINDVLRSFADDPDSVTRQNANWARRTAAKLLAATGDYQNLLKAEKLLASNAVNGTLAVDDKLEMASILAVRPEPVSRSKATKLLEEVEVQRRLSPELDLMLGKLYYATGNWPKCRDHMQSVLTRYPKSAGVRNAYIRMLLDRGGQSDLRSAERQVKQLIQIAPNSPATLELVSLTYNKMGDNTKAKQALRRMLPSDPNKLDANGYRLLARVANLMISVDDVDAAEKLLTVLVGREGATLGDQLQFIQFVGIHRDVDRAFTMLDKAADESNLLEVAGVGSKIVRLKRDELGDKFDDQINKWLDRAEREDPGAVPVLLARANLRDVQGRYEEAARIYRQVLDGGDLQGEPKAAVLNNLAYMLALGAAEERTPNEAVSLLREAVDILGPISDILDTRATIWIGRGEYQAAVDDLELAVTDKATGSKYFHKALAHMGLGQKSEALAAWDRAENLGLTRETVGHLEQERYDKLKGQIEDLKNQGQGL